MKIEHDSVAVQADRPRQDPREPAQVRHARRDDRPQGARSGQHSRCRSSTCRTSATARTARAASGRATAKSAQPIGTGGEPTATAQGQAGSEPGGHILEVEVSLEELAEILGEELELPRIEPKGKANIEQEKVSYTSIRRIGPESLRHFKRTYMRGPASGRSATGTYDAGRSARRADQRRQALPLLERRPAAARPTRSIIYMMDVSRLDDRRAEGDRPHRGVLDRHLAAKPVRGHRDALHHPRRGGQGSRRAHVLPHPRKRRHADQLGLQGVRRI